MKHTTAIAALVVAATSLVSLPVAAQDTTAVVDRGNREIHRTIIRDGGPGLGRGAGILGLVCSPEGAERLEIAFVRLSHRLDLTAEQQPLFDTLKDKALTTQTSFADECASARPDQTADSKPDLLERMKLGLRIEEARLTALNAVLPDFEALYTSLTDDQKASLMPMHDRGMGDRGFGGRDGQSDRGAPGRNMRGPAPGR